MLQSSSQFLIPAALAKKTDKLRGVAYHLGSYYAWIIRTNQDECVFGR